MFSVLRGVPRREPGVLGFPMGPHGEKRAEKQAEKAGFQLQAFSFVGMIIKALFCIVYKEQKKNIII